MKIYLENIPQGFLIDGEDFALIMGRSVTLSGGNSVSGRYVYLGGRSPSPLHRKIMKAPKGFQVDHVNGDRLDNRKANLRLVTPGQNQGNSAKKHSGKSSKYKGVHFCKTNGVFVSRIGVSYKKVFIGQFKTARAAALAYDRKARAVFGECARLNFPRENERGCL